MLLSSDHSLVASDVCDRLLHLLFGQLTKHFLSLSFGRSAKGALTAGKLLSPLRISVAVNLRHTFQLMADCRTFLGVLGRMLT